MSQYPKYRSSSIGLIRQIPSHWGENTVKRGFEISLGKMLQSDRKLETDSLAPYLRSANVQWGAVDVSDIQEMWFSPDEATQLTLEPGDLVACEGGDAGRSAIWQGEIAGCYFQNSVNRVRSYDGNSTLFLMYWLSALKAGGFVDIICNKATIAHLSKEKLANLPMVYPPVNEQIAIAAYLDAETKRIDDLIKEKTKLLSLLAELRSTTITDSVTKGLNPKAILKDSGDSWLGKVPKHWDVVTFQRCVYVAEGQVDPREEPYKSMLLIAPNHIESGTGHILYTETAGEQFAESGKYLSHSGDVIYSKIRPALRKVCIAPEDCICSADMYPLRGTEKLTNNFLMWFMLSEPFSALAVLESERVAMPKINRDSLKKVWIALPPIDEQLAIHAYIEAETHQIDALISHVEAELEVLKELRSSTITDAVLGRIDVRKAQAH